MFKMGITSDQNSILLINLERNLTSNSTMNTTVNQIMYVETTNNNNTFCIVYINHTLDTSVYTYQWTNSYRPANESTCCELCSNDKQCKIYAGNNINQTCFLYNMRMTSISTSLQYSTDYFVGEVNSFNKPDSQSNQRLSTKRCDTYRNRNLIVPISYMIDKFWNYDDKMCCDACYNNINCTMYAGLVSTPYCYLYNFEVNQTVFNATDDSKQYFNFYVGFP